MPHCINAFCRALPASHRHRLHKPSGRRTSGVSLLARSMTGCTAFVLAAFLGTGWAAASPVHHAFEAELSSGALAGERFAGDFSFDPSTSTGVGQEFLRLTSLDFTVDGVSLTHADLSQGGEVVLDNGKVSYFTAAYFVTPPPESILTGIAFGFGGPGVIGYSVAGSTPAGSGAYTILPTPVPEPASSVMICAALATGALWAAHRRAQSIGLSSAAR